MFVLGYCEKLECHKFVNFFTMRLEFIFSFIACWPDHLKNLLTNREKHRNEYDVSIVEVVIFLDNFSIIYCFLLKHKLPCERGSSL